MVYIHTLFVAIVETSAASSDLLGQLQNQEFQYFSFNTRSEGNRGLREVLEITRT